MNTRPEGRPTARHSRRRVRASNQSIDQCLFSTLRSLISPPLSLGKRDTSSSSTNHDIEERTLPRDATLRAVKEGSSSRESETDVFFLSSFFPRRKNEETNSESKEKKPRRFNGSRKQRPCSCSCSSSSLCSSFLSERRSPIHEWTRQRCRRRHRSRSGSASAPATASATADGLAESPPTSTTPTSSPPASLPLRPPHLLGPRQRRGRRRARVRALVRDLADARQVLGGGGPRAGGRARVPGAAVPVPRGAAVRRRGRLGQPRGPLRGSGVAAVARGDSAGKREGVEF